LTSAERREIREPSVNARLSRVAGKVSDAIVNVATFGGISAAKRLTRYALKSDEKRFADEAGTTENKPGEEYAINFGYAVRQHAREEFNKEGVYATQRDARNSNIISPILLNDETLRQHVQIIGTTGSGKTQLLKSVLEQQIARGGGAFAVFGKADNVMLQQIYAVAVEYGREQDFFVVDWTATKEQAKQSMKLTGAPVLTNAINLFDLGSVDDVVNSMIKIAGLDKNTDKWGAAAKDYLSATLRLLALLKDADLTFDIDKIDEILSDDRPLDAVINNREELSFYTLSEIITSMEKTFKLVALIEKIYTTDRARFEALLFDLGAADHDGVDYAESTSRDEIHLPFKKVLETQINGITVDRITAAIFESVSLGFEKLVGSVDHRTFYKLEVSKSQLGELITFYDKFALVLKNKRSDFDFVEAFRSGKIIIFNVPGQESEDARIIGKMVMAVLNLLIKKQGKAPRLEQTFLAIFDEVNSWAKGSQEDVFGLGDILSVVRGLGMAGIVAHQSSLDSMGKNTSEREQVQANINTKIVLKTESTDIIREINELVGKREVKYYKDKIKNVKSISDDDAEIVERDYFKKETLGSLWAGQGFFIRNRVVQEMVTYYLPDRRFGRLDEETIPVTKTIELGWFL